MDDHFASFNMPFLITWPLITKNSNTSRCYRLETQPRNTITMKNDPRQHSGLPIHIYSLAHECKLSPRNLLTTQHPISRLGPICIIGTYSTPVLGRRARKPSQNPSRFSKTLALLLSLFCHEWVSLRSRVSNVPHQLNSSCGASGNHQSRMGGDANPRTTNVLERP